MKDQIRTVSIQRDVIIDKETGEIEKVFENKVQIVTNSDKFALIYASLWNVITESNLSKADIDILGYLINTYGSGAAFQITAGIKEDVAKKSGKSPTTYNKSTKALLETGFIYKIGGRSYKLNPKYAFEGSSNNRKQALIEMKNYCKTC